MCTRVFRFTNTYAVTKHMRVSARREGRGCRIAGRGLVFTLISHRVSRGCQTLRPPPCGVPSFHRIRASRVPIPSLLFSLYTFFLFCFVSTKAILPNCAHRSSCVKKAFIATYVCHNICNTIFSSRHTCSLYFYEIKKKKEKCFNCTANFIDFSLVI